MNLKMYAQAMEELNKKQRKILSLALFGLGMRAGPPLFNEIEEIIKSLGIEEEFAEYATDFIDHSKKNKENQNGGN